MLEIEKKFLITKKTFFSMFQKALIENRLTTEFIDQIYLFKSNSKIAYNPTKKVFVVTIENKSKKATIEVPVVNEEYQKKLQSFIDFEDIKQKDGLYFFKGTYRIRLLNGQPIFTFKRKVKESSLGMFEFEETVDMNEDFESVLFELKSRIVKIRHKIAVGDLTYEIDLYQDFDFISLEIEFDTEELYKCFVPDFDYTMDASNESSLKNKNLAKQLLKRDK